MKLTLRLTDIIITSLRIIKTDYFIVFPYLILSLFLAIISPKGTDSITTNNQELAGFANFIFIAYVFGLIIQAITIQIAHDNLHNLTLDIGQKIKNSFRFFPRLLASSFIMLVFFFLLLQITITVGKILRPLAFIIVLPLVIIFFLLILAMEFLPIFIILEKETIFGGISRSFSFIRENISNLLLYAVLLLFLTFFSLSLTGTLHDNPVFQNILLPLIHGLLGAFVIISTVVVYIKLKLVRRNESEGQKHGTRTNSKSLK